MILIQKFITLSIVIVNCSTIGTTNPNAADPHCNNFYTSPHISYWSKISQFNDLLPKESSPTSNFIAAKKNLRENDPMEQFQTVINNVLFGPTEEDSEESTVSNISDTHILAHYPSGRVMRAELFMNKSGVHLPISQFIHRGHCYLKVTKDDMQTAVDAFSIILEGTIDDVLRLPSEYILRSARTISMMKLAQEKLVATWTVVKGPLKTAQVSFETLEKYRPLFKYLNGREIAKLNLTDERILSYIGTHADLDRHQVGVVASKYMKVNKNWREAKYLNLMNNIICGVPLIFMRKLSENTYLQLSHQLFYHITSCDPLQRRFYLHLMTRTQVLGKSNSWGPNDVARLGLLFTEVDAPELSAISPRAMAGINAQVMLEMPPQKLQHLTEPQLKYIGHKPMSILSKKMHLYKDELLILNSAFRVRIGLIDLVLVSQYCNIILPYLFQV